ncbi:hypothetical protein M408DRAFT_296537 [Serendipita vermifera MAFF 305830]|uniref:Uncharacterized protein n=1 Tax=Serendipita vermifera MAFF 305830 TaxID=933852 RepID=A0A0C2XMV9_SERVB|nr:hypothetical protein M408DRAFT_296537 [Serendipita vermifera MAFF 305830]
MSQAIIASYPEIDGHIESIIQFSDYLNTSNGDHVDNRIIDYQEPSGPLVITTIDRPSTSFMVGSLYASFTPSSPKSMPAPSDAVVPPLLQIIFVKSKLMVQRAYRLPCFALQMIHLTRAALHLILSLSAEMTGAFGDARDVDNSSPGEDKTDLLRVAPTLAQKLEGFLNSMSATMDVLSSRELHFDRIQARIDQLHSAMCEDYPGAVAVRYASSRFKTLVAIDREEAVAQTLHEMGGKTSSQLENHTDIPENGSGSPTIPNLSFPNTQRLNEILQGHGYNNFSFTTFKLVSPNGHTFHQGNFRWGDQLYTQTPDFYPNAKAAKEAVATIALPYVRAHLKL